MKIEDLKLSTRAENSLLTHGIHTVEELIKYTGGNLVNIRNFGRKSVNELRTKLLEHNLCLAGDTVISSEYGIELIQEIPTKIEKIRFELCEIHLQICHLQDDISKILSSTSARKIE